MSLEFDPKKDGANVAKHGLTLSEGDGVLRDTLAITMEDERADGEQRFVTVGANVFGELRVMVWTGCGDDVRIISVRRPTPAERKAYEG
ncbi:MAG: BrnT family toxin [Steroidobacteraceae bacterium]